MLQYVWRSVKAKCTLCTVAMQYRKLTVFQAHQSSSGVRLCRSGCLPVVQYCDVCLLCSSWASSAVSWGLVGVTRLPGVFDKAFLTVLKSVEAGGSSWTWFEPGESWQCCSHWHLDRQKILTCLDFVSGKSLVILRRDGWRVETRGLTCVRKLQVWLTVAHNGVIARDVVEVSDKNFFKSLPRLGSQLLTLALDACAQLILALYSQNLRLAFVFSFLCLVLLMYDVLQLKWKQLAHLEISYLSTRLRGAQCPPILIRQGKDLNSSAHVHMSLRKTLYTAYRYFQRTDCTSSSGNDAGCSVTAPNTNTYGTALSYDAQTLTKLLGQVRSQTN